MVMAGGATFGRRATCALAALAVVVVAGCESPGFPGWRQGGPPEPVARPAEPPAPTADPALPEPPATGRHAMTRPLPPLIAPTPRFDPDARIELPEGTLEQQAAVVMPQVQEPRFGLRVALLLPLSGSNAAFGGHMLNAAQLALFDFGNDQFEVVIHDTRGTPEGAELAARNAIAEGSSLILGPLLASSVQAVAPPARAAGIEVVAFSNDPGVAGDGVHILGIQPAQEVERIIDYAARSGLLRFAVLAPTNAYGDMVTAAFHRAVAAAGGAVVAEARFDPQAQDFGPVVSRLADYDARRQALLAQRAELERRDDEISRQALKRLANLQTIGDVPYNALLIGAGGKTLQNLAALLPYYDIDPAKVRMLGTGQWDVEGIGAEPALAGGWFAAPSRTEREPFLARYRQTYGQRPPRLVTLAYDAVALAAVLAHQGHGYGRLALTAESGFAGRDGLFRLRPDGINQRGLSVYQIRPRDIRLLEPAPEVFPGY